MWIQILVNNIKILKTYSYSFKCNREDHAPADCETTTKWLQKAKDDSETSNWLVANTKCCPKCKRQIEKNGGCVCFYILLKF